MESKTTYSDVYETNLKSDNLAVIILNYFGFELCKPCVKSVLKELNCTVYLVDNSSNVNERQKLEREFGENSNVNLLFSQENLGFAAGVNSGLKHALEKGHKTFFLLNNDTILIKGSGSHLKESMKTHPCTLISPQISWDTVDCGFSYYHRYLGLITKEKPLFKNYGWSVYLTGCALIFDHEVLHKIGFLDSSFFMYGEDAEFSYRALQNGIPLSVIPKTLIHHKAGSSSTPASFFYEYHINRAHFLLSYKINNGYVNAIAAVLLKFIVLGFRSVFRCVKYGKLSPAVGFLLAFLNLPVRPSKRCL